MFFYLGEWGWLTFSALLLLLVKVDIIMIRYILLFVIKFSPPPPPPPHLLAPCLYDGVVNVNI